VTTGDPSAHKTSPPRAKDPSTPTKSNGSTAKDARAPTKPGTVKKRAPRAATPKGEAEVLERLNKLAEPEPVDETLSPMPIPLPAIIEADPSFPVPTPSHDQLAKAAVAERSPVVATPPQNDGASAAATADSSARAEVSAPAAPAALAGAGNDLPTEATAAALVAAVRADLLAPPDIFSDRLDLLPDRTELVPAVMPDFVPTEAIPEMFDGALEPAIDETTGTLLPQRPLQRPIAFRRGKPRVRRVTRVVRHVDTWSVFKVAVVFNTILFMVCLTSGVLLWNVAHATGTVDNVEKFFEQFGWSSFEFNGGALYHNAWIAGLFVAIGLTGLAVLLATLFNLITDLVGGIRVSVLEEEVIARSTAHSTRVPRHEQATETDEPG
jgi:Transmembrane domain of unknown function (DUF3566)